MSQTVRECTVSSCGTAHGRKYDASQGCKNAFDISHTSVSPVARTRIAKHDEGALVAAIATELGDGVGARGVESDG